VCRNRQNGLRCKQHFRLEINCNVELARVLEFNCCVTLYRYKKDKDGYYRLLTVRYESIDMKEEVIPGLSATVSELYCPGVTVSSDSLVVGNLAQSTTADPSVSMSNLELLGSVAFAMSRGTDGADDGLGQPVVLSTNADGIVMAENDGANVVYILPAGGDGEVAQSFGAVVVEPSSAEAGDDVVANDCVANITNTASLYFTTTLPPDSYDPLCNAGPVQFRLCNAATETDGRTDDMADMEDDLTKAVVSAADVDFLHTVDMPLDPFSLAMLTNTITS